MIKYGVPGLAAFLGGGSLILFLAFTYWGGFDLFRLTVSNQTALVVDASLSFLFFLQHSLMIRKRFHDRVIRFIPDRYSGALFSIMSGLVLICVVVFWQKTDILLLKADGILYWMLRVLFVAAIAGFYMGSRALGGFDPFGARALLKHRDRAKPVYPRLKIKGPYRWVRHPLYSFTLILIWSHPYLTADRLLFNVLWTIWIVIGTYLEERDLIADFGDDYRNYQKQVPMLIPYKKPVENR